MNDFPTIPGFEFTALLGRGGMAAVYAATQTSLGREVAIKVVEPDALDATRQLQRLENEARSLAGLHHPTIVQLYDFGRTAQGAMFYVMPLLPGGDLTRWTKPVAAQQLIPVLDRLLDALAHAHAAGIVHRDIKPENILFDREDRPLLADFGAAQLRRKSRLTETGTAIGSTGYMSPEQARGTEVDARSDLYSLAVLAFEMLTGRLPFDGPDALAVALAQIEQPVPRLPGDLAHWQGFFERALAVDPQRRYATAAQMRAALQALPEWASPTVQPSRPSRGRWYGLAALVATVLLGATVWWWREPGISPESIAVLISQGALAPPDDPNALQALQLAREQGLDPDQADMLQKQLLQQLEKDLNTALQTDEPRMLLPAWRRWHAAVAALNLEDQVSVVESTHELERRLTQSLERAVAGYDRAIAADALALVDEWKAAPQSLRNLADKLRGLPQPGERFSDKEGPELVFAKKPEDDRAGLAVMTAALQPALYATFMSEGSRKPASCDERVAAVQGCVGQTTAREFAEWLSRRTGQRYRLPTRGELAELVGNVAPAPVLAWTSDCNEVRSTRQENAVRRTWGEVRNLFGRDRASPRTSVRCDGYLALPLDGSDSDARVIKDARADTTVVLVREIGANRH